jgi:hypothetical protein
MVIYIFKMVINMLDSFMMDKLLDLVNYSKMMDQVKKDIGWKENLLVIIRNSLMN